MPDDPGFHTILLHPTFDRHLGTLDFAYDSAYGVVRSSWSISGNTATWKLTIPPNSKGFLPLTPDQVGAFKLDDKPLSQSSRVHSASENNGQIAYEVPSGSYQFAVTLR